ncbi:amidase family protein [Bradyrhizobium zhanjiangense]|uniref:amidase family protein n=1 Tax=Bradyrhizobium zhanjiangense TaxID=1325107 RepID=UPI0023EDCF1C|nr:amidase family protein [Bradyrhizobium zhanjiangense]
MPAPLQGPPLPKRVAVSVDPTQTGVNPVVAEAVQRAGRLLEEAGYTVEAVDPPDFFAIFEDWFKIIRAEAPYYSTPLIQQYGDDRLRKLHANDMKDAPATDTYQYMEALARRTGWIRRYNIFMRDFPLLLHPVSSELPLEHSHDRDDAESLNWMRRIMVPCYTLAVLGLPAISVPTGLSGGLPTGVQIVGPRFREDILLEAAAVIEAGCPMETPIDPRF